MFMSRKRFTHFFDAFVAKTIYALRPESFCALKSADWKVLTFFASVVLVHAPPATEDRRGREKSDCGGDLINRAAVLLYSESTPRPR